MNKIFQYIKNVELEAWLWIAGLTYLLLINPYETQHISFCPFKNMGINFCPGCGMGRSISYFYHLDFLNSIRTHPLGIVAFLIIAYRIFTLLMKPYHKLKNALEAHHGRHT